MGFGVFQEKRAMKVVRLTLALLPVLLVSAAAPALSSTRAAPALSITRGVKLERAHPGSRPAAPGYPAVVPQLRVADPRAYATEKAQAVRGYDRWLRSHDRTASHPIPLTSVSDTHAGISDPSVGTPPDTTGAAGPDNYVEMVNSEIAVYPKADLSTPTSTVDEATFTGATTPCDGQIQWDQQGQRWLYVLAGNCAEDPNFPSALYFGWSKTAAPTLDASNWCQYELPSGSNIEDYPKLGHDGSQILIGANEFDFFGDFNGSFVYVFDKPADPSTCPTTDTEGTGAVKIQTAAYDPYFDIYYGGFTPVPANIADSSSNGYVAAIDLNQAQIDLYTIGRDISGNNVLLATANVAVPQFCVPAPVPQPGTSDTLDDLDSRLTQAVAVTDPGTGKEGIWTQHTVAQGCSGGFTSGPSVVRWYELTPGATSPTQIGTVTGPGGAFAFMGAISPSSDGQNAAIFYNSGSSTQMVDLRVQDRHTATSAGQMIEDTQLAASPYIDTDFTCNYYYAGEPCRWGDYNGATPDPSDASLVWGTGELTTIAPNILNPQGQWGTQNAAIDVAPASTYTLNVSASGSGTGSVSSNPAGIACGGTCSHDFPYGSPVQLNATPGGHSVFSGWSGDCTGTGACSLPMGGPQSVTATFTLIQENLSVSTDGSGSGTVTSDVGAINCGISCSHSFEYGTTVHLTASPDTGSIFTGWSGGGCSGTDVCAVAMTAATSVSATFEPAPETLTVNTSGTGKGTISSNPDGIYCDVTCFHDFDYGTGVTLTATPAPNAVFTGWSGAGCSGTSTCGVYMVTGASVTATFAQLCVVPKVKGKTLAAAKAAIGKASCSVGSVKKKASKAVKKGRVISESPGAGKKLADGARVNLVVSTGKARR